MKRTNPIKRVLFILLANIALIALGLSPCFAEEGVLKFQDRDGIVSFLSPPSDNSWAFLDLPLGKYRFHTSVQLEQMNQSKVSPPETNGVLDQKALSLNFSIGW